MPPKKKMTIAPMAQRQLSTLLSKMRVGGDTQTNQQRNRNNRRAKLLGPPSLQMGDAAMRYAAALCNPFSKEAEGVRVPEPYAVNTITRKVHIPFVLTSSATGGLDFAVQPHLVVSTVQTLGTATGGVAFSPVNLPAGVTMRSALTATALSALVQNYRIVAIGVRIKTNINFNKSGGRIYGAILPASQELPAAFNLGCTVPRALGCLEIPNDGTNISTNILALPRGFQFTVSELMSEGGCEVHFPICSARALDFLDGQPQNDEQHLTITVAGGVETQVEGLGRYCAAGHSQLVIRGEGLEANTDVLSAEVVYHVEGIPLVGTSQLVESMPHTPSPSTPNEIHRAHIIAAARPVVTYVSNKLKARDTNGSQKKGALGAAERVLGLAVRGLEML